ncbi:MAG: hypothetical protein PWP23_1591 [Candidatus Sumerlaeota bacterium]|nr:hypothetical protein [Candidatus Sumerlaeota bacterium]
MTSAPELADLDPQRLYLLVLGIGNAFTRRFFNSSFLLIAGGQFVAIDCPAPFRRVLHDAGNRAGLSVDLDAIDHLVLTHLHGDHCNGLEEYGFFRRYVLPGKQPGHLYLLPENLAPLWERRLHAVMAEGVDPKTGRHVARSLEDYFLPHCWEPGEVHRLAGEDAPGVEFAIRRTRHPVPCFGFRASFGGVTLGYSADSPFETEHLEFLASSDLIVHEAGEGTGHAALDKLQALDESVRRKIVLIHVPDAYHERDLEFPILEEGRLYEVGNGRSPIALNTAS